MIEPERIIDNMKPIDFRFDKRKEFLEYILPLTKYDEQYIIARQYGKDQGYVFDIEDDF